MISAPAAVSADTIAELRAQGDRLLVALDFDGTLAPIAGRPEDAALPDDTRALLERLGARRPVWIVSGRDLPDLRAKVGLAGVGYAGCHGYDIAGPGIRFEHPAGLAAAPALDALLRALSAELGAEPGVQIEKKRFSLAVHYRLAPALRRRWIAERALAIATRERTIRTLSGKRVIEVLPEAPWNKGEAVRWICERSQGSSALSVFPIYIGDDATDESAFSVVAAAGLGILVADAPRPTAATRWLPSPAAVAELLRILS